MNIITDEKLKGLGFEKTIIEVNKDGFDFKMIEFKIEYNYYLHNKQRIVLSRKEGGKYRFTQFDGYYQLSIRYGEKRIESISILLSKTNDLKGLKNIIKGLKGE